MKQWDNSVELESWMDVVGKSFLTVCLAVFALVMTGCVQMKPAEDTELSPPDMDRLCALIRSHDEQAEGDPESLEYIKQYSKSDGLAEKNRQRLRSICYAWSYKSPSPPVKDIRKGTRTFAWTDACEIAAGSFNEKLGMPEASSDPYYNQYRRYLSTALDVEDPADKQDLICYFAVLDRDNDQIPDYTVSDHGRFVQNDIDVDNDGVRNVRDVNPVDAHSGQPHVCGQGGFPEHLRLSTCGNESDEACKLQEALYKEFDVVVVNREFVNPARILASLRVIYDVMNLIFKQGMINLEYTQDDCPGKPTLPSFKTVAFENCPHDTLRVGDEDQVCLEDASTTGAEAIAQNGTFVVVPVGADYASLVRLGTYVHELGHLFSFAFDYDKEKYENLVKRNYWQSSNFREVLKPMGWSIDLKINSDRPSNVYERQNVLNVEDHVLFDESSYKWNGFEVSELRSRIECGVDTRQGCSEEEKEKFNEDNPGYLAYADEFRKQNDALFTWYGAADPWEWYAEAVMAYVYRILSEHIATRSDTVVVENTKVLLRARVLENYSGNEFYFENMSDSLFKKFEQIFPMTESQLDELVCRYIVNSDDVLFGGDLKRTPKSYDDQGSYIGYFELNEKLEPEKIQTRLAEKWKPVCDSFKHLEQAILQH